MAFLFGRKKKKREKPTGENPVAETILAADTGCSLHVVPANYQHIGARENQEDAFAFSDLNDHKQVQNNGILALVADGMGGLARGEEASNIAVSVFLREYGTKREEESIGECLIRALRVANAAVFDLAFTGGEDDDLGTTLVAVVVYQDELHWIATGDSRIYLFREGTLKQLTTDHIYANHLLVDVENGRISLQEAENHPERNYLTSYLGLPELDEVDQNETPLLLKPGDRILLCSDGLYDTLNESRIATLFKENRGAAIAEEMVKQVLCEGSRHQDNVTVVVLSIFSSATGLTGLN